MINTQKPRGGEGGIRTPARRRTPQQSRVRFTTCSSHGRPKNLTCTMWTTFTLTPGRTPLTRVRATFAVRHAVRRNLGRKGEQTRACVRRPKASRPEWGVRLSHSRAPSDALRRSLGCCVTSVRPCRSRASARTRSSAKASSGDASSSRLPHPAFVASSSGKARRHRHGRRYDTSGATAAAPGNARLWQRTTAEPYAARIARTRLRLTTTLAKARGLLEPCPRAGSCP